MIDTTTVAPASPAPAGGDAPVAAPVSAPEQNLAPIDIGSIQSQEDADRVINQMTPGEIEQILAGKSPEEVLAARAKPSQAQAPAAPAEKPAEAPAEKPADAPAEKPSEEAPELTAEILAAAHPALQNLQAENIQLLEQLEQLESERQQPAKSKFHDDPFIRMREEMLEKGNIEVPVVVDFERDLGVSLDSEIDALLNDENLSDADVKAKIAERVRAFQKEANTRLVGNLHAARTEWERVGEKRATFRTELQEFCKTIPEAKASADPLIIRSPEGHRILNETHPASAFAKWVSEAATQGLITDEQVERLGWEWAYTTWKSATKGHNVHMADVRKSAVSDKLAKQRALRESIAAGMRAPTLGLPSNSGSTTDQFHGFAMSWILASPENALQAQAKWRAEGNTKAIGELLDRLNPRTP